MTAAKRKISVSLDADLVDQLEASDAALSAQVNDAVRDALDRRRRQRLLAELCDGLDKKHGRVAESLIARFEALLA